MNPTPSIQLDRKPSASAQGEAGHWVTIEGHHIFIRGSSGHVPARLAAEAGEHKRFSRAAIERHLVEHHEQHGGTGYSHHDEAELERAGGTASAFRFKDKLPGEVRHFIEGRPAARKLFQIHPNGAGEDALSELGDRYWQIAEALTDGKSRKAVEFAHRSNDPEIQFLAAVHDNLPPKAERVKQEAIKAEGLRVGEEFTIQGERFRVAEDEHGMRVLMGGSDYPEVPVDALKSIPIDKGSLRTKGKAKEYIPFSRPDAPTTAMVLNSKSAYVPAGTLRYWKESLPVGTFRDGKGLTRTVTPERIARLIENTQRAIAKGHRPFLPPNHDERSGDRNFGYVVDLRTNADGNLELLHEFFDAQKAETALKQQTSIYTLRNVTDEDGEHYDEVIDHNACLPDAQLGNLKHYVPAIAASRGAVVEVVELTPAAPERKVRMDLSKLRTAVGAATEVPDDEVIDLALGRLGKLDADLKKANETLSTMKTENLELSRYRPKAVDPDAMKDRAEAKLDKIAGAVSRGDLPNDIGLALSKHVTADGSRKGKPNGFMLSRNIELGDESPVDFVLGLFEGKKLGVPVGQVTAFSRETPNDRPEDDSAKQMEAGRKQAKDYAATLPGAK